MRTRGKLSVRGGRHRLKLLQQLALVASGLSQGFVPHVAITRSLGGAHSLRRDTDLQSKHSNEDCKIEIEIERERARPESLLRLTLKVKK